MIPFELDTQTLIVICAAISVVLFAEAVYLLGFSSASYRSRVNRRLKLSKNQPDREAILIQLRRERGLTSEGAFRFGLGLFNRLMLESGMARGPFMLAIVALVAGGGAFFGAMHFGADADAGGRCGACRRAAAAARRAAVHAQAASRASSPRNFPTRWTSSCARCAPVIRCRSRSRWSRRNCPIRSAPSSASRRTKSPTARTSRPRCAISISASARKTLPLFVTAVSIQGSTGGNLSEILENLSAVIRQRFKMRRKIKALAAEGKFSALFLSGLPVAIFFLLNIVAPDFYASVWNQSLTKMGLTLAGTWMCFGNIVMYKMCNFRI